MSWSSRSSSPFAGPHAALRPKPETSVPYEAFAEPATIHAADAAKRSPSQVLRARYDAASRRFDVDEVALDDGAALSGCSVALPLGGGRVLLGCGPSSPLGGEPPSP